MDFARRDWGRQAARLIACAVPEVAQKRLLPLQVDREDRRDPGAIRRSLGDARDDRKGMAEDKG